MSTLAQCARIGLAAAAVFGAMTLSAAPPARQASCIGPPQLEGPLHSHPNGAAYAALGNWFGENHKMACAIQTFQAGVKLEPDSPALTYLLGLSLFTAGRLEDAVAPLQNSIQLQPNEDKAHLLLATTYTGLGRAKEAFVEWAAALKIDPKSKMAMDGMAKILIAAGDYETVINHLGAADRDENLTLDLAIAYGKAGLYDDAARVLNEGLKTYPNSDSLTRTLVTVYVKQLRYEEAGRLAEKLASRNPADIEAQRIYLRILVINGENATAEPLARKLLALAPHDSDFLYLMGVLERQSGAYVSARKHLEEAVVLNPNHYNSRYNYGVVLEELNDTSAALVQLEKAIELGATEPEIRFELAKVLRTLGETEKAQEQLKLYQKALKDKSDRTLAAQKSTQAAQAAESGDNNLAASLYREASAALPDDAGLAYRLALVLNDLGDMQAERAELLRAIKVDPTFALAQYQLGYVESRGGDTVAAEQQFRLAIKAAPGYIQAWIALAATLATESRFPEAQDAVANALKLEPNNEDALQLSKSLASATGPH